MMFDLLLLILLATVIIAIEMKDLLWAVIVLGVGDMLIALLFLMMNAPDVAITQVAVIGGLSTLIFVVAIKKTTREEAI